MCCDCRYFSSFMGSAGYCKAQSNKITDMIDIMDTCHNGFYKHKYRPPMWIFDIKYRIWKFLRMFKKKKEPMPLENFQW